MHKLLLLLVCMSLIGCAIPVKILPPPVGVEYEECVVERELSRMYFESLLQHYTYHMEKEHPPVEERKL